MDSQAWTQWAFGLILGAIGGALGTFVALRTTLYSMRRDLKDEQGARERLARSVDDRMDRVERRQLVTLRLTADIARQVGVDQRKFDDALVRMLADDDSG